MPVREIIWRKLSGKLLRRSKTGPKAHGLETITVRPGQMGNFGMYFVNQFLIEVVTALIIAWLLSQAKPMSFWGRVMFVVGVAAVSAVAGTGTRSVQIIH